MNNQVDFRGDIRSPQKRCLGVKRYQAVWVTKGKETLGERVAIFVIRSSRV